MKRKAVVITIVIVSCLIVFAFFSIMMVLALTDGDFSTDFTGFGPKVAVVELYGEIYDSRDFVRQIERWTDDGGVKAIVVDINSPGGAVAPSQEMYDQLYRAREAGKIVVASMGSVAASGGYYVACAADEIVANPGTLTGSIGVILSFPTAQKLFDKIGVQWETVKSGELKDVGSMDRRMTPEEERMLQAVIDDSYEQFVEAVAVSRDRDNDDIYPLADGSIFTGRQAYNLGLVDTLGSFRDAVSLAGELAGLGPDPDIVRETKRQPGLLDLLTSSLNTLNKVTRLDNSAPALKYIYR